MEMIYSLTPTWALPLSHNMTAEPAAWQRMEPHTCRDKQNWCDETLGLYPHSAVTPHTESQMGKSGMSLHTMPRACCGRTEVKGLQHSATFPAPHIPSIPFLSEAGVPICSACTSVEGQ